MLYEVITDFGELRVEREKMDAFILDWASTLREDWLGKPFEFKSRLDGKTRRAPAWVFVTQLFNHQTHHRGQLTTLIKQLGYDPGATDIPWMPGAVEFV